MMYKTTDKKALITSGVFAALTISAAIVFASEASSGARLGIVCCADTLVPSLFPFMFISAFTVRSGLSAAAGRLLKKPTERLFGLSGEFAAVVVMSVIGGYPVGAGMIASLLERKRVSESESRKAAYFCVASGAGFMITLVGARLLGSIEAGLCIYAAQACSVVILGISGKFLFKSERIYNSDKEITAYSPLSESVVESTADAVRNTIGMCGIVVLFSALISVIERFFDSPAVGIVLEVTRAVSELSQDKKVVLIAFAAGFGGLCVHFQIFRLLKGIGLNKTVFFLFRIMQGIITALLSKFFIGIFGVSIPVFSSFTSMPAAGLSTTALGSTLLIITGACFLASVKGKS